jgi:DNA-binding transcriptional ArsR family regulator
MIRPVQLVPLEARIFRSLGDEGRLVVATALAPNERRVTELVETTRFSQSTVSTHLAALHSAGLVARRPEGRQVWFGLAHPAVGTLLDAAEEVVVAASEGSYACISPCCNPEPSP